MDNNKLISCVAKFHVETSYYGVSTNENGVSTNGNGGFYTKNGVSIGTRNQNEQITQ